MKKTKDLEAELIKNKEVNKDVKSKETDQNKKTEVLTKDMNKNTKKIGEKNGTKD